MRHVTSGGSFGSSPLLQTIGLGRGARVKRIEVDWPTSRTRQVVEDVPVNRTYEMVEGKPGFRLREHKPFKLGGGARDPAPAR